MRPSVVTNPDWLRRPTGEDIARVYPRGAQKQELNGRATLTCAVDADGMLQSCAVSDEDPVGEGFGAAVLALSSQFKLSPQTRDGQSVAGGTIKIPMRFVLPGDFRSPPIRVRSGPFAGTSVDVDCRFRGVLLDNCAARNVVPPNPAASAAAVEMVSKLPLPKAPPRPIGRVVFPIQFVAAEAPKKP
jgi:TonB family protein